MCTWGEDSARRRSDHRIAFPNKETSERSRDMSTHDVGMRARTERDVSGWAIGGTAFAGVIMLLIGVFHAIAGLVALIDDQFYVVGANYTFELDVTGWGWIHLLAGIGVALAGLYVFSG